MSKFTLFMVHGIGEHRDAGWAFDAAALLDLAWERSVSLETNLTDHVDIVPITYDDIFDDYLSDYEDVASAVFSDALNITGKEKEQIATALESAKVAQRPKLLSYICDVLLYKMDIVKEQVNVRVARQLYEKIASLGSEDNFGIVAHSLGTRVINDTLQNIRSGKSDQANFYKQGYRLKFLMQVSDVTDLFGLPFNQDKYPPKDVYSYDTYDYLRTVTNRFDPIARMIPTRLDHWPSGRLTEEYMGRPAYKDILIDHVHEINVHGLTHYMLHPEITDEIFELCGFGRFLREKNERRKGFPTLGPQVNNDLKNELKRMMSDVEGLSDHGWQTYIQLVLKFGAATENLEHERMA